MILSNLNDIINQNNKLVLHIYDDYKRIYVAYFENNIWTITRNMVNIYFTEKYNIYSLLIKLNIQSIDKYNDIEYLIQCRYYIHKITIIQRKWKKILKKKLWRRVGMKLLIIIAPHLGNPKLSGVRKRLFADLNI